MTEPWPIIAALMGGTSAMRKMGKRLMPQQPREDDEDYAYRVRVATLFPAFARTVAVMAGKPFSKQVTLSEDMPEEVRGWCDDIDGEGRSLHVFAADLMAEVVSFGFGGILVDHQNTGGTIRTKEEQKKAGVRPYWIHVRHENVLGWRTERFNGSVRLSQLRIAEEREVPDGDFGTKTVNRVRVLEPGSWTVYEETAGGYVVVDQGINTIKQIPFVPIYGRRLGFMRGAPPLLDLAHQNVKHWQSQSDQDDSARFARKRLLVFIGIDDTYDLTASSSQAMKLPVGGGAQVIQGSAESVTVGRSELDALEAQMIQAGAELLMAQPGQRTATEAANDAEANKSELQRIVESFEDALDQALQLTAEWIGKAEGGHVSLFKDFAAGSLTDATAQLVLAMQQSGMITKLTTIREAQRRGILSPDVQPEEELAAIEAEGPALGMQGVE